ncbi:GNAT family N-acetyltransferase [Chryseobacterium sp.]|uniref:GNAT family N-acetyltransferase n=1 Tax=Chryseobacterium sp. TaxID=1871047 RepID=UPI0025BBF7B1|nr:GNAT family N-acetyltransferase [Chryseobacterium sp.]
MTQITLIQATLQDIITLQIIGKETFYETFAPHNTEESMNEYLEKNFTEEKLGKELTHPDSQFFIAWENDQAIGYLKVNSGNAQTELQDDQALEIERIYVKAAYHGKKVGQILYEKALDIAKEQHKSWLWLGVWEENKKAIRFYEKNGFTAFDKHIFRMGEEEQTDIMMRKTLE